VELSDERLPEWVLPDEQLLLLPPIDDVTGAKSRAPDYRGQTRAGRHPYVSECKGNKVLPLPIVVRRRKNAVLNLKYYGMGEKLALGLALSLEEDRRPLEVLHIGGNCLSEGGASAIVRAVIQAHAGLRHLDMSGNLLGQGKTGGKEVAEQVAYLINIQDSMLMRLILDQNQLSDDPIATIANAVMRSKKLVRLSFHNNRCGEDYNKKGAEALGTMLSVNESVTHLDLSKNMFKGKNIDVIGDGLSRNKCLTSLNMANNALGDEGAGILSDALVENKVLTHLNLKGNAILNGGGIALGLAFSKNTTLKELVLDWNPLGATGGLELLKSHLSNPTCRDLSLIQCDLWLDASDIKTDVKCKYNSEMPSKKYELDLSLPVERAILYMLIVLAVEQEGQNITSCRLDDVAWNIDEEKLSDVDHIPKKGICEFKFTETKRDVTQQRVMSRAAAKDTARILKEARPSMRLYVLLGLCSRFYFETEDLESIGKCFDPGLDQLQAYVAILAHTYDLPRGHAMMQSILGNEIYTGRFKEQCGVLFSFNRANITGHYRLDLNVIGDRMVLKRLMEICSEQQRQRRLAGVLTDNSQKGNNEFWRNETIDGVNLVRVMYAAEEGDEPDEVLKVFEIKCNGWAIPERGFLEFDVASLIRPPSEAEEMEPEPFEEVMKEARTKFEQGVEVYLSWMRWEAAKEHDRYFSAAQVLRLLELQDEICGPKEDPASPTGKKKKKKEAKGKKEKPKADVDRQNGFIVVWERIVDEENLECVTRTFSERDTYLLRKRVGTLNMFNPFAPDGPYCLDFGIPEDRVIACILMKLSETEDGESIINQRYTEMVVMKDPETKADLPPKEITWGDPDAVDEEGNPDPKLSKPYYYDQKWGFDPAGLPPRNPWGGPIWEFEYMTFTADIGERRRIAEEILGWEFDEGFDDREFGETAADVATTGAAADGVGSLQLE